MSPGRPPGGLPFGASAATKIVRDSIEGKAMAMNETAWSSTTGQQLGQIFDALLDAYGPQHWWPGDGGPTEIIIGAILTQNTNWKNVEKALAQLRAANLMDWAALRDVEIADLAQRIRPAGYYNLKARRLKHFVDWLWAEHDGEVDALAGVSLGILREDLLRINGIGPETADAILLYALEMPTFVVDAYTRRVAVRHRLIDEEVDYERLKSLFEDHLPEDVGMFNEYHALLVEVGKRHCKPKARCEGCPLATFPHDEPSTSEPGGPPPR